MGCAAFLPLMWYTPYVVALPLTATPYGVAMKTRNGTPPTDANGLIGENEDSGWTIYRRARSAGDWLSLKIAHLGEIEGAANYWLGWNLATKRFARTGDIGRLQTGNPDLLAWVESVMIELYPTLTEADMAL